MEEPSIFEQSKPEKAAEDGSIFNDKPAEAGGESPKKKKTGLIVAICLIVLAVIGGVVALVLILLNSGTDYEKVNQALKDVNEVRLSTDFDDVDFSDLANGSLSQARHDRAINSAKEAASGLREYADDVESTLKRLEEAGAGKSEEIQKRYEAYKKQADSIMPKLRSMATDLDKYIEFSDRYYNSEFKDLNADNYDIFGKLDDEEIERVFQPLLEAETQGLKDFGQAMIDYIKLVAEFYGKYVDYIDGTKEATEEIYEQLLKDMDEFQDRQTELEDKIDADSLADSFDLQGEDITNYEKALDRLMEVVEEQLKKN